VRKFRPKTPAERLRFMALDRLIAQRAALAEQAEALARFLRPFRRGAISAVIPGAPRLARRG
jgi:hypothetical protein